MPEDFADRVAETAAQLHEWCLTNNHHVCPDDSVYEFAAALLIDRAPGTLGNWRANGGGAVPFYRSGRSGRVRYRLHDLADYIERQRQDAADTFTQSHDLPRSATIPNDPLILPPPRQT